MKKKETFLQLHERLSTNGVYWTLRSKERILAGLCVVDFHGRDLCKNRTFNRVLEKGYKMPLIDKRGKYSPMRQNIILLCAAINNEL